MDTKTLAQQIEQIIKTGAGYGPEYLPVLGKTLELLKQINQGVVTGEQYFELGQLLLELQDQPMALSAFQQAWQENPQDLSSATYIGLILEEMGQFEQATQVYLQINDMAPDNTEIVEHLLSNEYNNGDIRQVLKLSQHFLSKNRQYAAVYDYVSRVFYVSGNYLKALEYIQQAAALEPDNAIYVNRLIHHLYKNNNYEDVISLKDYLQTGTDISVAIKLLLPKSYAAIHKDAEARTEFVRLLKLCQGHERLTVLAEIALYHAEIKAEISKTDFINRYILRREPDNSQALTNLALFSIVRTESLKLYRKALEQRSDDPRCRMNYGLRLLEDGELEQGFELYESRVQINMPFLQDLIRYPAQLHNTRLLIWNEQGLGDQFIWSRLFQYLERDAVDAQIQVDPRLESLLSRSFPALKFTGKSTIDLYQAENLDDYDGNFLMASLGKYYYQEIYLDQEKYERGEKLYPHLTADPSLVSKWRSRISSLTATTTIGICWRSSIQGNMRHLNYLTAEDVVTIFKGTEVTLINLQYSYTADELAILKAGLGERFIHFDSIDLKDDQEQLAAMIMALDAVFSVATAVSALSGALGQRTFSPAGAWFLGKGYNVMLPGIESIKRKGRMKDNLGYFAQAIIDKIELQS